MNTEFTKGQIVGVDDEGRDFFGQEADHLIVRRVGRKYVQVAVVGGEQDGKLWRIPKTSFGFGYE